MKPWTIPTKYMHEEIAEAERQDKAMAECGWIKIQNGMWVKPDCPGPSVTSQHQSTTGD